MSQAARAVFFLHGLTSSDTGSVVPLDTDAGHKDDVCGPLQFGTPRSGPMRGI